MAARGDGMNLNRQAAAKECQSIDEMANLARDTPAAFAALEPAIGGYRAGIDAMKHDERARARLKGGFRFDEKRRKAAVEAHRQNPRCGLRRSEHIAKLLRVERERLLAKDMLARLKRLLREAGMSVVARCDNGDLRRGVGKRRIGFRRNGREAMLLARVPSTDPRRGHNRCER